MNSNALKKKLEIISLFGKIDFDPEYNYKKPERGERPLA